MNREDIFTTGIWVVLKPDGTPMEDVCATSGYSARATALRQLNKPWSVLQDEGYRLVRCGIMTDTVPKGLFSVYQFAWDYAGLLDACGNHDKASLVRAACASLIEEIQT